MSVADKQAEIARQEIQVMKHLQRKPSTRMELEYHLKINRRRMEYLLHGLREVDFVYRVPGTHLIALRDETV